MQGKQAEAIALAQRLKASRAEAADLWVKKAEALSFIEDDVGVVALLEEAKQAGELDQLDEFVWHWGTVAKYRTGISAPRCLLRVSWFGCARPYLQSSSQ